VSAGEILLLDAAVIAGLMIALWLVSLRLRDASIVDPFWGLGFVIVGWTAALAGELSGWGLVLALLTSAWGLRLSFHLARRNLGHGEDFRYQSMRKRYPRFELTSLVIVFGLQGLLLWIVALPLQLAPAFEGSRDLLGVLGAAVWAVGLAFEVVGDAQLARFRADPANKGRVLDTGLWRYTRHPNYFGDACVWWGLWLVALAAGAPWWTVVGPIVMTVLLRRVSGVTLLERSLVQRRPGYEEYVRRTSPFVPRPPRAG
jgi:steroid 5-alpha reductase family enzyme